MEQIENYIELKKEIIEKSFDEDGLLSEDSVLRVVLEDYLLESKKIDSGDVNIGYFSNKIEGKDCKINGFMRNETKERLQVFILNSNSLTEDNELKISKVDEYKDLFKQSFNFIRQAIGGYFHNSKDFKIDDIPNIETRVLIQKLVTAEEKYSIDVIEFFVISLNVSTQGGEKFQLKKMEIRPERESIKVNFEKSKNEKVSKEIDIVYNLIDLNYLYEIHSSVKGRDPIVITLEENQYLEAIKVANESDFQTFLTVIPAPILVDFYKKYSYRLLEKNVRSFLEFRGVNKGMKETMKEQPQKFVAFNNGLTITTNKVIIKEIGGKVFITELEDFQIVNGGQTTASIYFTNKEGIDISNVNVMAKINVISTNNEEFDTLISEISKYSNSQNKVNTVDLKSNNPVLQKIKSLSDSVSTPSGRKWFYERSRGELHTIKRFKKLTTAKFNNLYPKEVRLKSAEMAKYYSAWGNIPYKIKKGGESIFATFLSDLEEQISKNNIVLNRDFYEKLIGRAILFRNLEILHGSGKNAIGQLRAAVVPYAISAVFEYCESISTKKIQYELDFDFYWKNEGIGSDSKSLFMCLMKEMYVWIDMYKESDDVSEHTKKESLWLKIKTSKEFKMFFEENKIVLSKIIREKDKIIKGGFYDFDQLNFSVDIHKRGHDFYKQICYRYVDVLSKEEERFLTSLYENKVKNLDAIQNYLREVEKELNKNILYDFSNAKTAKTKESIVAAERLKKNNYNIEVIQSERLNIIFKNILDHDLEFRLLDNVDYSLLGKVLEDVQKAYYNNFEELFLLNAKKASKVNLKYHIEYLFCLKELNQIPSIIDLYQLLPLYL